MLTAAAAFRVGVIMAVIMIVRMAVATAAAAFVRMSMRVGIDQSGGETAFHRHRLLDGRVRRFHAEGHHLGGDPNVVHAAEVMAAQTALTVENQRRWRALDLIGRHGRRDGPAVDGILGDREREALLAEKGSELVRGLRLGLFECGVEPDHDDLVAGEALRHPLRLRQTVLERSGAVGLEGGQHDDAALEALERARFGGIEPHRGFKLGRVLGVEHGEGSSKARAHTAAHRLFIRERDAAVSVSMLLPHPLAGQILTRRRLRATGGDPNRLPEGSHMTATAADKRARLVDIVKQRSFQEGPEMKLASGKTSTFYFNMKPTMLDPEGAALIAELMLDAIAADNADLVGGLEMGAVPIASAIAAVSHLQNRPVGAFFVRKQAKEHGTQSLVEGLARGDTMKDKRVVIVEDVTTTGGSALKAAKALEAEGAIIVRVLTIVDRLDGAADAFRDAGLKFVPILTLSDFRS